MENLSKAKVALIQDAPFFASLLLGMKIESDPSVPTLETNGEFIKYNEEFLKGHTLPETVFLLGHETLHVVFQHMTRRGNRDPKRWNIAADYIVNDMLIKDGIGIAPKGALVDADLVARGNGTTEGVYDLLESEGQDSEPDPNGKPGQDSGQGQDLPGPGDPNGPLDNVLDASEDAAELAKIEAETKVKVIQAANAAKACGKLSAGLDRIVKEFTRTKTDWRAVLRRFLSERAKTDYSFARPKRRFLADDLYLPSLTGEKLGSIVIAVDCSGSVSDAMLAAFATEIKGIIEDVQPSMTHVLYFDTEIMRADSFGPDDEFKIKAEGGGGTKFSPIFEYVNDKGLDVTACVVLTDLDSNDFGPLPSFPVLWASTRLEKAPFGEIVRLS